MELHWPYHQERDPRSSIATHSTCILLMILRLSSKLGTKIKVAPKAVLLLEANRLADWSGHLFTADRTQYVILTNTASLYSAIAYARGMTNDSQFIARALDVIREALSDDGFGEAYRQLIAPETGTVRFSKALSRSVTGSMNDMIQCWRFLLERGEESPFDVACRMNDMPFKALNYSKPREVFSSLIDQ